MRMGTKWYVEPSAHSVLFALLLVFGIAGSVNAEEYAGPARSGGLDTAAVPDPPALDLVEVSEITAHGVEVSRAKILADAINSVLDTLRTLPRYEDWRATVATPEGRPGLYLGSPAGIRGIARLSAEDLFDWSLVQFHIYEQLLESDVAQCAQFARGQGGIALAVEVYNRLSPDHVRMAADLHARGLIAELEAQQPLPELTPEKLRSALIALAEAVRGPANKITGQITHADRFRVAEKFEDIVAYELRVNGTIENDESQCLFEYIRWSFFPELDGLRHKRLLVQW